MRRAYRVADLWSERDMPSCDSPFAARMLLSWSIASRWAFAIAGPAGSTRAAAMRTPVRRVTGRRRKAIPLFQRPTGLAVGRAQERFARRPRWPVSPHYLGPPFPSDLVPEEIRRFTWSVSRSRLESAHLVFLPSSRLGTVLPRSRGNRARALARARRVPRFDAPARGSAPLRLLRRTPDRQRPAGQPPRAGARVQGRLPALQDDARPPGHAQGRLGLPRAAGRARGRE